MNCWIALLQQKDNVLESTLHNIIRQKYVYVVSLKYNNYMKGFSKLTHKFIGNLTMNENFIHKQFKPFIARPYLYMIIVGICFLKLMHTPSVIQLI